MLCFSVCQSEGLVVVLHKDVDSISLIAPPVSSAINVPNPSR